MTCNARVSLRAQYLSQTQKATPDVKTTLAVLHRSNTNKQKQTEARNSRPVYIHRRQRNNKGVGFEGTGNPLRSVSPRLHKFKHKFCLTLSDRSFRMAAPGILKSLPTSIRDADIVNLLKRQPNTNYFKLAY